MQEILTGYQKELAELISRLYETAGQQLASGRKKAATNTYAELLNKYNELSQFNISDLHKNIAYDCVKDIHDQLVQQDEPVFSGKTFKLMAAVTLLVIILGIAFILKPEFIGLFSAPVTSGLNNPINYAGPSTLHIDQMTTIDLSKLFIDEKNRKLTYYAEGSQKVKTLLRKQFLTIKGTESDIIKIGAVRSSDPDTFLEKTLVIKFN